MVSQGNATKDRDKERESDLLPFKAQLNRPASKLNRLQAIPGKNAAGHSSGGPGSAARNREIQPSQKQGHFG
ncbi:MAG TPA: hypothetical protein VE200_14975 [Xanthobacteraceae bacterium]|jgi:hypothetical protein|nr:hypothetical protein [Xanthobacteraceae bacterium]